MKHYSLRFIVSARFINALLNSLDNTLSNKTFNAKCKHCKKLEECKKCKKRQDDSVESCDRYKECKKNVFLLYMLCNEIYEDCKCYLEYVKVTNKRLCLKV